MGAGDNEIGKIRPQCDLVMVKSKLDVLGSDRWVQRLPYESPTLSMYERIIASPTTARIDLVACTSCKFISTNISGELTYRTYQHRCEVLGKTPLVPSFWLGNATASRYGRRTT